jgi:hypothetical protein
VFSCHNIVLHPLAVTLYSLSTRKIFDEKEEYLRKIAMLNGYGKIVRNEASALHFSQCFHKSSVTEASNAFLWSKWLT